MKDSRLDHLLSSVRLPERATSYWTEFPRRIRQQLRPSPRPSNTVDPRFLFRSSARIGLVRNMAFATVFILIGMVFGFWIGPWNQSDSRLFARQLPQLRIYYREIRTLFPRQLQAIVFTEHGARLMLSDTADVPESTPIVLKICQGKSCQSFITFSGQRLPINGEWCEVLLNAQGHVLVVGNKSIWSSAQKSADFGPYRIQARLLEAS